MTDETGSSTAPTTTAAAAKKTSAAKRAPAKKMPSATKAVVMVGRSRGIDDGAKVMVDAERADELIAEGLAREA